MTLHTYHRDIHEYGLDPTCPRCKEHAISPMTSLDQAMLARLASGVLLTELDRQAAATLRLQLDEYGEHLQLEAWQDRNIR